MDEKARVVAVHNRAVTVQSEVKSTCSQCQQVDNCGSGQVAKALPHKTLSLTIDTNDTFNVGDEVIISIPENAVMSIAWQVYFWPLFGLMVFAGITQFVTQSIIPAGELAVMVMAGVGGYLGFRFGRYLINRDETLNRALQPVIKQKLISVVPAN
ncbi:SoxR reducing system RseC family protein [Thalassotalea euphylliae]|uniref:SoxR reducing system RseC family protein n=1 Tax=Thalassotalea euphylliae TaxID=1655234 RepID=UPI003624C2F4